ncbi:MAG: hypothetical protein HYR62_09375 [Actinobacteria bacterium]|nr:hypothetical protein [Actinomycetota bacterium]MBI3688034.1 hypothetical protein [Actinomycetota bacterium]
MAYTHLRLEPLRRRSERGASAVEWAVIAGITVAAAIGIGALIMIKIRAGAAKINQDLPDTGVGG